MTHGLDEPWKAGAVRRSWNSGCAIMRWAVQLGDAGRQAPSLLVSLIASTLTPTFVA